MWQFHPNIYPDGTLCLDLIQDNWSPIYSVRLRVKRVGVRLAARAKQRALSLPRCGSCCSPPVCGEGPSPPPPPHPPPCTHIHTGTGTRTTRSSTAV